MNVLFSTCRATLLREVDSDAVALLSHAFLSISSGRKENLLIRRAAGTVYTPAFVTSEAAFAEELLDIGEIAALRLCSGWDSKTMVDEGDEYEDALLIISIPQYRTSLLQELLG